MLSIPPVFEAVGERECSEEKQQRGFVAEHSEAADGLIHLVCEVTAHLLNTPGHRAGIPLRLGQEHEPGSGFIRSGLKSVTMGSPESRRDRR